MKVFQGIVKCPQQDVNSSKPSYASNVRAHTSATKSDFTTFSYANQNQVSFKGFFGNLIEKFIRHKNTTNDDMDDEITSPKQIKELTDDEFEAKKNEIREKIDNSPEDIKEKLKGINPSDINKYNIFVLESTLNNPELFKNKNFTDKIKYIIRSVNSAEKATVKTDIMDKIKQHPELLEYQKFTDKIASIIDYTDFEAQAKFVSKIIDTPQFFKYPNFTDKIESTIDNSRRQENSEPRTNIIDKLASNPQALKNENIVNNLPEIIKYSDSKENYKVMNNFIDSFDKISNEIDSAKKDYQLDINEPLIIEPYDWEHPDQITMSSKNSKDIRFIFDKNYFNIISIAAPNKNINMTQNIYIKKIQSNDLKRHNHWGTKITHNQTGVEKTQIYNNSKVKGEYNIYDVEQNGRKYKTGLAEYDTSKGKHVEKSIKAIDGSKTDTIYADDGAGNRFSYYSIKDKNGNLLTETTRKFKVLSNNHFVSTKNEQSYDIEFSNKSVVVTKLDKNNTKTNEIVKYNIININQNSAERLFYDGDSRSQSDKILSEENIPEYTADKKLLPLLKKIPGDEWFALKKAKTMAIINYLPNENKACSTGGEIFISNERSKNLGTFEHEAGHEKFRSSALDLNNDKKLLDLYNNEKHEFTTCFPAEIINSMKYLLKGEESNERGLKECAAETNLLYSTHNTSDSLKDRRVILQQYFPKTVAYIMNKYNELE